jgi:hypothetical protein
MQFLTEFVHKLKVLDTFSNKINGKIMKIDFRGVCRAWVDIFKRKALCL